MNESARQKILIVIFLALVVVGAVALFKPGKETKTAPDNSTYYTGPMRNKAHPELFTTDDGRIVPPPPGVAPPPDPSTLAGGGGRAQ